MLVLQRDPDESIVIDGPAIITLVRVKGRGAIIGVEAPRSTQVMRAELPGADQLMEAKKDAGI